MPNDEVRRGLRNSIFEIRYSKFCSFVFLCISVPLCLCAFLVFAGEVKLDVESNRNQIYLGESIILKVKVSGVESPPDPDLSALKNCTVNSLGSHSQSYQQITIINGIKTVTGFSGRIFTYQITPSTAGKFTAGPVTLNVKGELTSTPGPTIDVAGIEKQEWVHINISASRESVLVDEPFEITLSIAIKRLEGQYANVDPIDPTDPPTLTVPFLNYEPIPGLETPDIRQILQKHLVKQRNSPGLTINNYTIEKNPFDFDSMFDFDSFGKPTMAKFYFDKYVTEINGYSYFVYTLKLNYIPKEEGSYTFGPVVFKGKIFAGVDQSGRGIGKSIFAVGPACTVRVVPPPEEGRPASYIGAIGASLTVEALLDTQTCNVGDPLKLTLAISGDINMQNIYPPPLNAQANLTRDFRIYEDSVQTVTKDGKKEYVYTIRPTKAGTLELPPIEVSYYDSKERTYKTVKTEPIPVKANEVVEVKIGDIIDTATNRVTLGSKPASLDIFVPAPLNVDPSGAEPHSITPSKWHVIFASLGPMAYFLVIGILCVKKRATRIKRTERRRNALKRAYSLLRNAENMADHEPENARMTLCTAFRKYLADRFDATGVSLTPADARNVLHDNGIAVDLTNRFCEILKRNFDAGYTEEGPKAHDLAKDCQVASEVIREVENCSNSKAQRHRGTKVQIGNYRKISLIFLCAFVPLCLCASVVSADNVLERQFIWNEANSRMASAGTQEDFLLAAEVYRKLLDTGVRNGPLFYNLGTALLMAKRYDDAMNAFLRAERYMGSSWDIKRNMLIAAAGEERDKTVSLPWYRVPMFWHFGLAVSTRMTISVCAFTAFWLSLILRSLDSRRLYRPLMILSLIVLVMFGSSVLTTIHQESKSEHRNIETTHSTTSTSSKQASSGTSSDAYR